MRGPRSLILVGVAHRDPAGHRRLLALLRRERPDRVALEVSRASLLYRRGEGARKRRAIAREAARFPPGAPLREEAREIRAVLRLPFEVRAARDYARETGAPLALLDLSRLARPLLRELDAWAADLLARLRANAPSSFVRAPAASRELARAKALLAAPERLAPPSPEHEVRDRFAARRLRAFGDEKVVHVCGWEHLATLAPHLRDLAPRRVLLRPKGRRPCGI